MKSYLLKREFFINNHKEQIKEHFDFIRVMVRRCRKSEEGPMELLTKPDKKCSPTGPESSNAFPKGDAKILWLLSTNSKLWLSSITPTSSKSMKPMKTKTASS